MRIKSIISLSILSLILISCSNNVSDPLAGGDMMFWKVSDDDSSVYLLGSMHFGKVEFYPMSEEIENAYVESDLLGVEIDMLAMDATALQMAMIKNMAYQDDSNLLDHISPETQQLLTEYLTEKELSINDFIQMKPGMITMAISAMEAQQTGLQAEYGIDMHFLSRAKNDNKPIMEFESIESQIEMLFGDEELAEGMLYNTLKDSKDFKVMLDSLTVIWQSGNAKAMSKLLTQSETEEESKYLNNLFGDRDVKMTEKIENLLLENKTGFIILGAGHYVNDTGIINKLATKKRYKIVKF